MASRKAADSGDQTAWLMENGGPVIRYRTATELVAEKDQSALPKLLKDLLASPMVRTWLGRLGQPSSDPTVGWQGGAANAFENVSGKLWDMGLRAGMPQLDQKIAPYRAWLADHTRPYGEMPHELFLANAQMHCVVGLARLGYTDIGVKAVIKRWIETFYQTASVGHYEPCLPAGFYPDVPVELRGKPVLKPGRYSAMPDEHHLYALAHPPSELATKTWRNKVDIILRYVLDSRFTERHSAVLRPEPHHAYAAGWGIDLPGLHGYDLDSFQAQRLVQRVEIMANFPRAQDTPWFTGALKHLDTFKTKQGRWIFPREYLREQPNGGSWIAGYYMGLEENRRTQEAMEIESTFRMLRIRSMVE